MQHSYGTDNNLYPLALTLREALIMPLGYVSKGISYTIYRECGLNCEASFYITDLPKITSNRTKLEEIYKAGIEAGWISIHKKVSGYQAALHWFRAENPSPITVNAVKCTRNLYKIRLRMRKYEKSLNILREAASPVFLDRHI